MFLGFGWDNMWNIYIVFTMLNGFFSENIAFFEMQFSTFSLNVFF